MASLLGHLLSMLDKYAYVPGKSMTSDNRIIAIHHSLTWPKYKDRVMESFKDSGQIRVAIATSALSMGVNFPNVKYVVHVGPARTLVDQIQQAGRAGRDKSKAHNIIIYHGHQLVQCEKGVKDFVKATGCFRKALFSSVCETEPITPMHDCCSNCVSLCTCTGDGCNEDVEQFQKDETDEKHLGLARPVTSEDREVLKEALEEVKTQQTVKTSCMGSVCCHGFSDQLIDDVVKDCSAIFTIDDIMVHFPVYSFSHAKIILEITGEIFNDIPGLDDISDMYCDDKATELAEPAFNCWQDSSWISDTSGSDDGDLDRVNTEELDNC